MSRLDLVHWIDIPSHRDERGYLTAIEGGTNIPFAIERVYYLHDVQGSRAGHAHRDTEQCLIPVSGECRVRLSDGKRFLEWELTSPSRGLYVVPMLFIEVSQFSPGAVLLVLASTHYDKSRSIRSWAEYLEAAQASEYTTNRDGDPKPGVSTVRSLG
jgi:hypothetical protein